MVWQVFRGSVAVGTGVLLLLLLVAGGAARADSGTKEQAAVVLARLDADRGICVLLDPDPAELAVELARASNLIVYVQSPSADAVEKARQAADAACLLGSRVYVERGDLSRVHLADGLADAVVVTPRAAEAAAPHRDELLRAVRPLGKLLLGDRETVKPWPDGADDWSHPYHGPDNNPQSEDGIVRAPYLTQFLAEPYYVPFPEVTVASAGRVFKAFGHVGYKKRDWSWVNTLLAVNGYNGTHLWKRPLEEGFNIHRNTMVATPNLLYVADSRSCKRIDAATGEVVDEIASPPGATGRVWKWMALEGGVLYALVGKEEPRDATLRGDRTAAGWPWRPMTPGYDSPDYRWGFGRTLFAVDPDTKRVLWTHVEEKPIDGRAVAMTGGRIYFYSHPSFLACLDAEDGNLVWRSTDRALLEAIGPHDRAQVPSRGFSSSSYLKAGPGAVFFAGPQRPRLVAASTEDGRLLWQYPADGNFQLVLRDQGLYAMGRTGPSKLFEPATGRVLADLPAFRGNCTRATGAADCIFTRGHSHGGTMRLVTAGNRPERIAPMRPGCHDGVIVSGGRLYWGPWMCDCSLSLVGLISLGPAGDFDFESEAVDAERLEQLADPNEALAPLDIRPGDWPAYRADNERTGAVSGNVPAEVTLAWQHRPASPVDPAAPIAAGGLVFLSGSDGAVRAMDAATGSTRWTAYTGGPVTYPPAIEDGRLVIGCGDGRVYAFEAATGRPLWRFRAAPAERKINLYGRLASTWPVAGGVVVEHGVVYAAAGIASFDGTHVYALDAASGRIRWQNNTSGRLAGEGRPTGVSVQGHLLLRDDRLFLAGGNVVSPAVYDTRDGRCLSTLPDEWQKAPRGRELLFIDGHVQAFDRLLYGPKDYWVGRYFAGHLVQAYRGDVLVRGTMGRVARLGPKAAGQKQPKALWESDRFAEPVAVALADNAAIATGRLASSAEAGPPFGVMAFAPDDGRVLWSRPLPAMPADNGLALDADGRVLVALRDGRTLCFAGSAR